MKEDGADTLPDEKAIALLRKVGSDWIPVLVITMPDTELFLLKILFQLAKMRKESIEMFRAGGREDMIAGEQVTRRCFVVFALLLLWLFAIVSKERVS